MFLASNFNFKDNTHQYFSTPTNFNNLSQVEVKQKSGTRHKLTWEKVVKEFYQKKKKVENYYIMILNI